ncbi:hypothetical protein ACFW1A_36500 [Kitasatospora sp. NPDC058965]|uniref:hypothetical protein n=1 Tax=Kitasatospora sp. NPDC058965 TaxID=3346682 RepID=UPI0036AE073A
MTARSVRLALALHPARHRREWGEELAAVYADTTAGAGPWAVAREWFDLAGHGVRLRLGLGSRGVLAQLAAMAAPFAAVAAAGTAWPEFLYRLYALRHGHVRPLLDSWDPVPDAIRQVGLLVSLVVAVAAVLGRWTPARLLAPLGLLLACLGSVPQLRGSLGFELLQLVVVHGPQILWVLVLLAAPRDLLGPADRRSRLGALAGVVIGGGLISEAIGFGPGDPLQNLAWLLGLVLVGVELALLLAAVPLLLRGWYGPAAAALAGSPVAALTFLVTVHQFWLPDRPVALVLLALPPVAGVLLHRIGPRIPARRRPEVG